MSFIRKYHLPLFFIGWFLLNLFQASFTGLLDDEAYYWVYSKFLDWGYYDHPPMIALLIKAGYAILPGEGGVRLFIVLLNTLTLFIIYKLLPVKNDRLFYAIASSIAVLQIGGIIAVPDLPLCFFVALFFLAYRNFLRNTSIRNTLFLGTVMALMLYSKYHGVLIIFFTLLSNLRLFKTWQAYTAALFGFLLFLPHLYWQYQNDFPSLYYHLLERNAPAYRVSFTLEYIFGQILLAGPLMGWLVLYAAFRQRPKDIFEKGLKYSLVGFYVFFLISSLRGRVEANWTIPAFVPLFILTHEYLTHKSKAANMLIRMAPVTLILVAFARVYLVMDIPNVRFLPRLEFHQNKEWANQVASITHGLPVVFTRSYQFPSKYWFYTGIPAFTLNTTDYRRNNYNFWPVEDSFFNKTVALIPAHEYPVAMDSVMTPKGAVESFALDSFFSFSKVKIRSVKKVAIRDGMITKMPLHFFLQDNHLRVFRQKRFAALEVLLHVYIDKQFIGSFTTKVKLGDIDSKEKIIEATFPVSVPPGKYQGRLAIPSAVDKDPTLNSAVIEVINK
jgi:hypothetical protein